MSWFKYITNSLNPKEIGKKSLSVCVCDDAERPGVEREIGKGDFVKLILSTGDMKDVDFLSKCIPGGPERLLIQGGVESLNGLDKLTNLTEFKCDLTAEKPYPNFGKLKNLESCWLAWDKKYDVKSYEHGLFTLPGLKDLTLRYWSKPDCEEIGKLAGLERLDLRQGSVAALKGLENCRSIKGLSLGNLAKLAEIGSVAHLNMLERIHIEKCPIGDLTPLLHLENLRDIHIEKVDANFHDWTWLANMRHIERIRFSCGTLKIDWRLIFNHPTLKDIALQTHDGYRESDAEILQLAESGSRKVINFKRIGTKTRPSFSFELQ